MRSRRDCRRAKGGGEVNNAILIHLCGTWKQYKLGDPRPENYWDFIEWSDVMEKSGQKERHCSTCLLWRWYPIEFSRHVTKHKAFYFRNGIKIDTVSKGYHCQKCTEAKK